jgi:hypothetical protein
MGLVFQATVVLLSAMTEFAIWNNENFPISLMFKIIGSIVPIIVFVSFACSIVEYVKIHKDLKQNNIS